MDGMTGGMTVVVEGKTSSNKTGWGEPWTDEIPVAYLFQVQHYLAVTNCALAHVAVMFGMDFKFAIYEVEEDLEFIGLMMETERSFWAMVENRTPPDPVTAADISRRWPISRPISKLASTDCIDMLANRNLIQQFQNKL